MFSLCLCSFFSVCTNFLPRKVRSNGCYKLLLDFKHFFFQLNCYCKCKKLCSLCDRLAVCSGCTPFLFPIFLWYPCESILKMFLLITHCKFSALRQRYFTVTLLQHKEVLGRVQNNRAGLGLGEPVQFWSRATREQKNHGCGRGYMSGTGALPY